MGINSTFIKYLQACSCQSAPKHDADCLAGAWTDILPSHRIPNASHPDLAPTDRPQCMAIDAMLFLFRANNQREDTSRLTLARVADRLWRTVDASVAHGAEEVALCFDAEHWRPVNKNTHEAGRRSRSAGAAPFSADDLRDDGFVVRELPPHEAPPPQWLDIHWPRLGTGTGTDTDPLLVHPRDGSGFRLATDPHAEWVRGAWRERIDSRGVSIGYETYALRRADADDWHAAQSHAAAAPGFGSTEAAGARQAALEQTVRRLRWLHVGVGRTHVGYSAPLPDFPRVLATRQLRGRLVALLTMDMMQRPINVVYGNTPAMAAAGHRAPVRLYLAGAEFLSPDPDAWDVRPVTVVRQQMKPGASPGTFTEVRPDQALHRISSRPGSRPDAAKVNSHFASGRADPRLAYAAMGEADCTVAWYVHMWAFSGRASVAVWSNDSDMLPILLLQVRDLITLPVPENDDDIDGNGSEKNTNLLYKPRQWSDSASTLAASGRVHRVPAGHIRTAVWLNRNMTASAPSSSSSAPPVNAAVNVTDLWVRLMRRAQRPVADVGWLARATNPVETLAVLMALGKCDFCDGLPNIGPVALDAMLSTMCQDPQPVRAAEGLAAALEAVWAVAAAKPPPKTKTKQINAVVQAVGVAGVDAMLRAVSVAKPSTSWSKYATRLREARHALAPPITKSDTTMRQAARRFFDDAADAKVRTGMAEWLHDLRKTHGVDVPRRTMRLVEVDEWAVGDPTMWHLVHVNERVAVRMLALCVKQRVMGKADFAAYWANNIGTYDVSLEKLRNDVRRATNDASPTLLDRVPQLVHIQGVVRRAGWTLQYWLNGCKECRPDPLHRSAFFCRRSNDGIAAPLQSTWGWKEVPAPTLTGGDGTGADNEVVIDDEVAPSYC